MNSKEENNFLLVCAECKSPFFTPGEKSFYISKKLTFPKRCKKMQRTHKG